MHPRAIDDPLLRGLFWLPSALLGYLFDACARAAYGMGRIADGNSDEAVPPQEATSEVGAPPRTLYEPTACRPDDRGDPSPRPGSPLEERCMADTNLNDDMVKLVQFAIVSIERRKERVLDKALNEEGTLGRPLLFLETDRITSDGFSNSRIADWVRDHAAEARGLNLDSLRVYYDVVARWPKEDLKLDEKSLDIEERKLEYLQAIKKEAAMNRRAADLAERAGAVATSRGADHA